MADPPKSISVVVPFFNEEGSLEQLHEQLTSMLSSLDGMDYDILFVNDGSTDTSGEIVDRLVETDPHVGVIHFRRNFGKAAALDAGFGYVNGDVVFTMDADLQDDPKEIPRFLDKLAEGFDVVSGWKEVRNDPIDKTLPSKVFNRLVSSVSGLKLHDFNCGFKAYRRKAVQTLRLYGEMHRFVPVLVHWKGFSVAEIPVEHHPRRQGKSKYGFERFAKGALDLMTVILHTRYRARPLHLFGLGGLLLGSLGTVALGYLFLMSLLGLDAMRPRPLLYLALLLIMVGVQFVSTGLLGELIVRAQPDKQDYEVQRVRPAAATDPDASGD